MLVTFRHSSVHKIFQFFFGLICFLMVATPIMSALKSPTYNPTVMKSPFHSVTVQDIINTDQNFMQTLYGLSHEKKENAEKVMQQYFRSISYKDFFEEHGATISDQLAWNIFLKQFGSEMPAEQYAAIEQTIKQRFGSRKQFLGQMKLQLMAQNLQKSLTGLTSPIPVENTAFDMPLDYSIKQYNFSPRDYQNQVSLPESDQMYHYFVHNAQRYIHPENIDLQAVFIEPTGIDLSLLDQSIISRATAELTSLGYENINDLLIQKTLFNEILEHLQDRELYSLQEAEHIAYMAQASERRSLISATQEQVNSLLETDGLFELIKTQAIENAEIPVTLVPFSTGIWLVSSSQYTAAALPPYELIASQVEADWKEDAAGLLAQHAAKMFIEDYKAQSDLISVKPSLEYTSSYLLEDRQFDDKTKIALAHLSAKDWDIGNSIVALHDGEVTSGVKVYVLDEVSFKNTSDDSLEKSLENRFDLPAYAYESATLTAFDHTIDKDYGYTVQPAFWEMMDKVKYKSA